jgi:hypothetical protein
MYAYANNPGADMSKEEFAEEVGEIVLDLYGEEDGADLCYNLVEMGVVDMQQSVYVAAQIVAQHIEQA